MMGKPYAHRHNVSDIIDALWHATEYFASHDLSISCRENPVTQAKQTWFWVAYTTALFSILQQWVSTKNYEHYYTIQNWNMCIHTRTQAIDMAPNCDFIWFAKILHHRWLASKLQAVGTYNIKYISWTSVDIAILLFTLLNILHS